MTQLRGVTPALSESDITRERLALEEAIRKVEAEAARKARADLPDSDVVAPPRSPAPPDEPKPAPDISAPVREAASKQPRAELPPAESAAQKTAAQPTVPQRREPRLPDPTAPEPERRFPAEPVMSGRPSDNRTRDERSSPIDQIPKGFRDGGADKETAEAPSRPAKLPREPFGKTSPASDLDRLRLELEGSTSGQRSPSAETGEQPSAMGKSRAGVKPPPPLDEDLEQLSEHPRLRPRFGGRSLAVLAVIILLGGLAVFAYRERASIAGLFQSGRSPVTQASQDTGQSRAKISDRVGGAGQQRARATPSAAGPAVAQRVALYEQQANTNERKQYAGSVIWRAETVSPGPGLPPDLAIKAEIEIPERQMRMSFTLRRNVEQTLPASHTIEIIFTTPPDFPPGGIADIPGVLMEQAEQTRGVPLTGLRVKVTNGFFLVGLSSVDSDVQRNVQLLKERSWLNVPIAYTDGTRALLAFEKGVPGDRVFADAFAAWQQ
jgi:hypothetical protein